MPIASKTIGLLATAAGAIGLLWRTALRRASRKGPTKSWSGQPDIVHQYDTYIFDCDGVLWLGNNPIPGAVRMVKSLKAIGKNVFFITNNSTKSRAQYMDKFEKLGFPVPRLSEMFTSSFAAAWYLKNRTNFETDSKKVFVIGDMGIVEEMKEVGVESIVAKDVLGDSHMHIQELIDLQPDPSIGAVVIGFDGHLTYTKIAYGMKTINQNDDCLFISTNQVS